MAHSHQLKRLIKVFGNECHYCGRVCERRRGLPGSPTIEHVVPRFFGGTNHLSNYVLACSACNQERGSQLFFCECYFCGPLIKAAINGDITAQFDAIIDYNRPKVKLIPLSKDGKVNTWNVRMGCNARRFDTFEEAITFANNGWPIKRPIKESNEVNDSARNLGER